MDTVPCPPGHETSIASARTPMGVHPRGAGLCLAGVALWFALGLDFSGWAFAAEAPTQGPTGAVVKVWPRLLNPREYPDDARRPVRPPAWETFGNVPQFTCLRGFEVKDKQIVGFERELDLYTRAELGRVIWPSYPILFAENLGSLAEEIRRRDLFLFDVWGYVPGSGPGGYWQQFSPPASAFAVLERTLGERWLGTDIGEQDGRYIGGYADQMTPASANRFEQYLNFQRHFERMGDDLGHRHATLVSLNYGHYFLKEGTYTLIGAETAQALPNNQVYYAFIRGAGKQYGVPWFGNASVYNRWGFKNYAGTGTSDGYAYGPGKGTSLSLMKRLLYSHLLYNAVAVGFESGWFVGDRLTPLGILQQNAQRWVKAQGPPGVLHTPVGLLFDFYAGWTFPRHLYTDKLFRVWGNLPYEPGDYLGDAILDLLYPGYADSSYFHDESGFITPTPYGDVADCLLSDAPGWVLSRYPVLVTAGTLAGGRELRDKLQAYLDDGGQLVITEDNLKRLPGGLRAPAQTAPGTDSSRAGLVVLGEPLASRATTGPIRGEVDRALPRPFGLTPAARAQLDTVLRQQALFEVGNTGLAYIVCRKSAGEYTLGLLNNTWKEQPFQIVSRIGPLESVSEIDPPDVESAAEGYLPEGIEARRLGTNSAGAIAGGGVRLFALKVKEQGVGELPRVEPPARPRGRILPLPHAVSLKREILSRPTFFEHYDGVLVDWRYAHERERQALTEEARWLKRQGVRVVVDFSSGVNLYPTLRLIDNLTADYGASWAALTNVLDKMPLLEARDLVLCLHRHPENNFTAEQTREAFASTLERLAAEAGKRGITLHLRLAPAKPPGGLDEALGILARVASPQLKLAPSLARPEEAARVPKERLGLWLLASARRDASGAVWDVHAPWRLGAESQRLPAAYLEAPEIPVVFDALYESADEAYLDAAHWETLTRSNARASGRE